MRYGYSRPTCTFSLDGSSSPGPDFETDVRLANSQPSEQTIISGIATSTPTVGEYVDIFVDWNTPMPIGIVAILNMSCPEGVAIEVTGRRLGSGSYNTDLLGNSMTQATAEIAGGRVQAVILPESEHEDFIGVQVRIYNDQDGITWADDTTELSIGEIVVMQSVSLCATPARTRGRSNRSLRERAFNGAAHFFPRGEYRTADFTVRGSIEESYTGGLAYGMDFAKLHGKQDDGLYRAFVVPRGINDYGTGPDYDLIQQVAMLCLVSWGNINEETSRMACTVPLTIEETP